jgi:hypothetical protein
MSPFPKIMGISCSIMLCLGLTNAAQAERMKADPCADRKTGLHGNLNCDKDSRQGIDTVKGQVLRIEGSTYVVERSDGKTVELFTDQTTQMTRRIDRGDWIEAKVREVEDQKLATSIYRIGR